jgi:transposase
MNSLDALFVDIDDFCQKFEPRWHSHLIEGCHKTRDRAKSLCLSEIMTILVTFHQHHYRNFKHYYLDHVSVYWADAFPGLPSYGRFIEWMPQTMLPLCVYLKQCFGTCTGISFIDSTCLKVCHNRRISGHKVFKNLAARGKTSVDWFFGFKLHLVVNENGELLNMTLTPGNTDDRKPVPELVSSLFGKIFADKGYVSQPLAAQLFEAEGIEFFAKPKRNMKNKLMKLNDKLLSRKRSIVETIIDQLKNAVRARRVSRRKKRNKTISQIEHSRHRSPINFCINVLCGLIAYCHQPKKPNLGFDWVLPSAA